MATKTFELVSYEKSNRIAWITINNESRMNALSTGVMNGLYDSFEEVDNDDDVLVAVLTGAGGRAFCAGADLRQMTERDQAGGVGTQGNREERTGPAHSYPEAHHCRRRRVCAGGRDAAVGSL